MKAMVLALAKAHVLRRLRTRPQAPATGTGRPLIFRLLDQLEQASE